MRSYTFAEYANAVLLAAFAARSSVGQSRPEGRETMGEILEAIVWHALSGALAPYSDAESAQVKREVREVVDLVLAGRMPTPSAVQALRARG